MSSPRPRLPVGRRHAGRLACLSLAPLAAALLAACSDSGSSAPPPPPPPPSLDPSPFHDPAIVSWTAPVARAVHSAFAGDLDGDGDEDLVVVDGSGALVFEMQDSDFAAPARAVAEPGILAVADVDADGRADLVAEDAVLFSQADGSLLRLVLPVQRNARPYPLDIDGDGDLDLFLASRDSRESVLLLQHDVRSFRVEDGPGGSYLVSVAVGDMDGDGDDDLVTSARVPGVYGSHAVHARIPGGWDSRPLPTPGAWLRGAVQGLVDHDVDGDLDVLFTASGVAIPPGLRGGSRLQTSDNSLATAWFENDGSGRVVDRHEIAEPFHVLVGVGDVDGGGGDEVVGWRISGLSVLHVPAFGAAGRGFAVHPAIGTRLPLGLLDLDGDGDHEIVTLGDDGRIGVFWSLARQLVARPAREPDSLDVHFLWRSPRLPQASAVLLDVRRTDAPIDLPDGGRLFLDPTRALLVPLPHDAVLSLPVPAALTDLWLQGVYTVEGLHAGNVIGRTFATHTQPR